MFEFGSIVLTRFPFHRSPGGKLRPALVISQDNAQRADVVLAFITSKPHAAQMRDSSAIRFDKLATLENQVIAGKIGDAGAEFLKAFAPVFFGVFGFGQPKQLS